MTTKLVRVEQTIIDKSKERSFQSPNQYILYLMNFEESNRRYSENYLIAAHNKIMGLLEMERLELNNLNKVMTMLVEKTDIELQLSQRERKFIEDMMFRAQKKGTWKFEE